MIFWGKKTFTLKLKMILILSLSSFFTTIGLICPFSKLRLNDFLPVIFSMFSYEGEYATKGSEWRHTTKHILSAHWHDAKPLKKCSSIKYFVKQRAYRLKSQWYDTSTLKPFWMSVPWMSLMVFTFLTKIGSLTRY